MKTFITFAIILYSNCLFCQNLILNYSFENSRPYHSPVIYEGTTEYSSAKNFDKTIANWKGRMPNNTLLTSYDQNWHSPDWNFGTDPRHVSIRSYEIVQQELEAVLNSGSYYRLKFKYRWQEYSENIKLEFYTSQNELKYKKEKLLFWQNEENHLCSEDYKNFTSELDVDYSIVASIENLTNQSTVTGEWYNYEQVIQVPENGDFDWFGFQTVLKSSYTGDGCITGYLRIDDIELEFLSCSEDPCSPTNGPNLTIHDYEAPYGWCIKNLDNIEKIENFKVTSLTSQTPIYTMPNIICTNGIKEDVCWPCRDNNNNQLAPAYYLLEYTLINDCGSFEVSEKILCRAAPCIQKEMPNCNNSINAPIECCGAEPDVFIDNVNFTGEGSLDLVALNSITAEDITVDNSVGLIHFQAGETIRITNAIISGEFWAEIKNCEPTSTHYTNVNLDNSYILTEGFEEKTLEQDLNNTNIQNQDFCVFPNPTSGELNIKLNERSVFSYSLLDFNSTIIKEGQAWGSIKVNISDVPPGLYLLHLITKTNTYNSKIIKR